MERRSQRAGSALPPLLLALSSAALLVAHAEERVRLWPSRSALLSSYSGARQAETELWSRKLLAAASTDNTSAREHNRGSTTGIVFGVLIGVAVLSYVVHRLRKKKANYDTLTDDHAASEMASVHK